MASVDTYLELRDLVETILGGFTACPLFMVDQKFDPPPLSADPGNPAAYVVCDPIRIGYNDTVTMGGAGELFGDASFLIHVDRRTGDRMVLELAEAIRTLFLQSATNAENVMFEEPRLEQAVLTAPDDTARYARRLNVRFHWVRG
jgi:hypothetical protein